MNPQNPALKHKTKIVWKGFVLRILFLLAVVCVSAFGFFAYKIKNLEKKVYQEAKAPNDAPSSPESSSSLIETAKNLVSTEKKALRGQERERINILLLGMGGEGYSGKYLTDTIILASINPKTYQSAFLSIPRDLYVEIPQTNIFTKINAVYAYEIEQANYSQDQSLSKLKQLIKKITGQEVDYYLAMDFDGFKQIIDEVGGVDIEATQDIYDDRYPGPNYSYETFSITQGFHHLDGETALKYSRVRHTTGGDFGRAARQQQIMAATKKKAFSIETFVNPMKISSLIDILGNHLKTDIRLDEIPSFIELAKNINIYQTTNKVLDAWSPDSLLASTHIPLGGVMAYTLIPRAKNYSEIQELSDNIFDLGLIERKKSSIDQENASIYVDIKTSENLFKIKNNFSRLGYKNVSIGKNKTTVSCQNKNLIINNTDNPKIFTIDDLAAKLEADVSDAKISDIKEDILICLSDSTSAYLENQNEKIEDENDQLKESSILDENGQVRVNTKNSQQQ